MAEQEFEGRTEEEAIQKAIEALGLTEEEIDVEVIEERRPTFLRSGNVRIRVDLAPNDDEMAELEPENEQEIRIIEFVAKLLKKANLGTDAHIQDRNGDRLILDLLTDEPAVVIGRHGSTLEALQLICNIYAGRSNTDGEPVKVILDTEDYRYRREQSLLRMANRTAHEVRKTKSSQLLAPLNPFERRIVHTAIAEVQGVVTESEGDGLFKQIRVSFKSDR